LVLVQEELAHASEAYILKTLLARGFLLPSASNTDHSAASDLLPVSPSATAVEPDWDDDENLYWYQHQYVDREPAEEITDQDLAFQEFCLGGRKPWSLDLKTVYLLIYI
jgi:hypothetical protein